MRRTSLALPVTLLVASLVVSGVPASAYVPPPGPTFNTPAPWGTEAERFRIVRTIERAINETRPTRRVSSPVISVSTYLLDRSQSVDALIRACRRNVQVRVILDEDIQNRNSRRLIKALNADNVSGPDDPPEAGPCNRELRDGSALVVGGSRLQATPRETAPGGGRPERKPYFEDRFRAPGMSVDAAEASVEAPTDASVTWGLDGSYVKRCNGSCRGAGGNMHSKFFLFSRTGKASNVVMVSSSNLNRGGAVLGWNDLMVMKGRPKSYQGYTRIHREMTEDTRAGDGKVEISDGPYLSRFFPMRDANRSNDPTLRDLRRIRCRSELGPTAVNVSMFYWKGTRGNYLATELLDLAREGCRVSIIYGAPSLQIAERLRTAARNRLIKLYDSRWDFNGDGFNEVRTHAKYVLVKGRVGTDRRAFRVWTGSQNWVAGSLSRGDEVTLNIAKAPVYRQYLRNWVRIRNHSRSLPYNY